MSETRIAVLSGGYDEASIARYLPSNYSVARVEDYLVIIGEDSHGWTLDGYVLPRLASGMFHAVEYKAVTS